MRPRPVLRHDGHHLRKWRAVLSCWDKPLPRPLLGGRYRQLEPDDGELHCCAGALRSQGGSAQSSADHARSSSARSPASCCHLFKGCRAAGCCCASCRARCSATYVKDFNATDAVGLSCTVSESSPSVVVSHVVITKIITCVHARAARGVIIFKKYMYSAGFL